MKVVSIAIIVYHTNFALFFRHEHVKHSTNHGDIGRELSRIYAELCISCHEVYTHFLYHCFQSLIVKSFFCMHKPSQILIVTMMLPLRGDVRLGSSLATSCYSLPISINSSGIPSTSTGTIFFCVFLNQS
jgi:hypothetical protein